MAADLLEERVRSLAAENGKLRLELELGRQRQVEGIGSGPRLIANRGCCLERQNEIWQWRTQRASFPRHGRGLQNDTSGCARCTCMRTTTFARIRSSAMQCSLPRNPHPSAEVPCPPEGLFGVLMTASCRNIGHSHRVSDLCEVA
jgi:hypothetical protein